MYIGLLNNSKEPVGYTRQEGDWNSTVFFDTPDGCGEVTHLGLFDAAEGGEPVEVMELLEPVVCGTGVIPVVQNRRLIAARGVSGACTDVINMDLDIQAY